MSQNQDLPQSEPAYIDPEERGVLDYGAMAFLFGLPIVTFALIPLDLYLFGFSKPIMIFALIYWFLCGLGTSFGYHRMISHRSFDAHPVVRFIFLLLGAACIQNSAIKWSVLHRRHHRHTDEERDPYNAKKGFWWAHWRWIFYKSPENDVIDLTKVPKDLTNDPLLVWQYKYYWPLAITMCFGLPTLVGWYYGNPLGGFLWGGCARVLFTSHTTYAINSWVHFFGTQPYGDDCTARNSWPFAFISNGEGYHNFHHKFQFDYRNGVKWYQWDPTKWLIRALSWLGLTTNLKQTSDADILAAEISAAEKTLAKKEDESALTQEMKAKLQGVKDSIQRLVEDYREIKRLRKEKNSAAIRKVRSAFRLKVKEARRELKTFKKEFKRYQKMMENLPATS